MSESRCLMNWVQWSVARPEKDRLVDIIFADGREELHYRYAGGVVLLMPPDYSMYTYAQPRLWRYSL